MSGLSFLASFRLKQVGSMKPYLKRLKVPYRFSAIQVIFWFQVFLTVNSVAADQEIVLGIQALRPRAEMTKAWQPLVDYLNSSLPGYHVKLTVLDNEEMQQAFQRHELDFALVPPSQYIHMREQKDLTRPLATIEATEGNQVLKAFGGAIFTRSECNDIQTLQDLKGKRIACINLEAFGGYLVQIREMRRAGISPPDKAHLLLTGSPQDNVVQSVLKGKADAGFVRSGLLEIMVHEGKINSNQLRVINLQNHTGYPYACSTPLYPEWPFLAMPQVQDDLMCKMAATLLSMERDSAPLQAASIHGFTIPSNYGPVEELLRELRLPPFDKIPLFTIADVWRRFQWWIIGIIATVALIALLSLRLATANRKLAAIRNVLVQEQTHLRNAKETWERTFNAMSDPVFIIDRDYRIQQINQAALKKLGITREAALATTCFSCIDGADKPPAHCPQTQTVADMQPHSAEMEVCRFGGFYTATTMPIMDESGHYQASVLVAHDITERKRAAEAKARLETQQQQLQKAESLSRMAGAIAHRYNNLLTSVLHNLEFSTSALPRESEAAEHLVEATTTVRHAAEVSNLLLTYLGQTRGNYVPVAMTDACQKQLPVLLESMPKGVHITTNLADPGPVVKADLRHFNLILSNLFTNAWEALPDQQGTISLTVKTTSQWDIATPHRFPLDWQPEGDLYACLEIKDSGNGIAPEDTEKLFDPFFTRKFTGRGLGLPVALGLIRAHHGVITVESKPGEGSTFRVYLPLSTEIIQPPPEEKTKPRGPQNKASGLILLVEDEDAVRRTARIAIQRLGFEVAEARDGVEAMEIFQRRKDAIRCVICDMTMPRMGGWETLEAMRKISPGIPFVLASGYDQTQVMAGHHPEKPQIFLAKPYQIPALREAIQNSIADKTHNPS